jgi:hypothetical protein
METLIVIVILCVIGYFLLQKKYQRPPKPKSTRTHHAVWDKTTRQWIWIPHHYNKPKPKKGNNGCLVLVLFVFAVIYLVVNFLA